jgi:hypothetical protein
MVIVMATLIIMAMIPLKVFEVNRALTRPGDAGFFIGLGLAGKRYWSFTESDASPVRRQEFGPAVPTGNSNPRPVPGPPSISSSRKMGDERKAFRVQSRFKEWWR